MIDKQKLTETVEKAIEGSGIFIVEITVSPENSIVVELDSADGIDIDTCAGITRRIEAEFDRDTEDYDLEVGSAGLTSPFKVKGQYLKNIGNDVEVLTNDGRKFQGTLSAVGDDSFTVDVPAKIKREGAKRPETILQPVTLAFSQAKSVRYVIKFK